MKTFTKAACLVATGLAAVTAHAEQGAPHTLASKVTFTDVTLTWAAPHHAKELKWHSGKDYNGDHAPATNAHAPAVCYAGAKFTESDLGAAVGEKVASISFFQYRPLLSATVLVYKNGQVVAQAPADMGKYAKNTWQEVPLAEAVEITPCDEFMFAVRFEYGHNSDFIAIKDEAANAVGKGDLFSTDGKNWHATAGGEYLITANLINTADEEATGYYVYDGETLLTPLGTTALSHSMTGVESGWHNYSVEAEYADGGRMRSGVHTVKAQAHTAIAPAPVMLGQSVEGLNVNLEWLTLNGGDALTWNTSETMGNRIGGTATTNTKVWIRNRFTPEACVAFAGGKITAISNVIAEEGVTAITLWIQDNGTMVYSQALTAEQIAAVKPGQWSVTPLDTPYEILPGHEISYGLYVLHGKGLHPIAVDDSKGVNVYGNSFSVSSPNSTNFLKSNPSWKTLASGNIPGNWMLRATVEGATNGMADVTYVVTRNGEEAGTTTTPAFADVVPGPGVYDYEITTMGAGRQSAPTAVSVNVPLPAGYLPPTVESATFDPNTGVYQMAWNNDVVLSHSGNPAVYTGFDEDMDLMWGHLFTAAQLQNYKDMEITSITFAVAEEVTDLQVGVFDTKGNALCAINLPDGYLQPMRYCSLVLPKAVKITGEKDLFLGMKAHLTGGTSPILLDGGPLVDGGARVSLTGGASWMNLATLNSAAANRNVYFTAMASEAGATTSKPVTTDPQMKDALPTLPASVLKVEAREMEVSAANPAVFEVPATEARPQRAAYRVYHNGQLVKETTEMAYTETLTTYGAHTYNVATLYANGWESELSEDLSFDYTIAQKARAPYGLSGEVQDNNLVLTWQHPTGATVLNYIKGTTINGLGTTGSSPETHCLVRFSPETLADHIGKRIEHVQFVLIDNNVKTLEVELAVGENIVYTQSVPTPGLITGLNDVRLNVPYTIVAGQDVAVGYHTTYASGVKPLGTDEGPAVVNYGDIISQSGAPGYWYSLATKFKMDQNWRISAILSAPDQELQAQEESDVTYNVYCDGFKLASGITANTYTVKNATHGTYHVTASSLDGETHESNKVNFMPAGVDNLGADATEGPATYYNLQGVEVPQDNLTPGIYLRKTAKGAIKVTIQ